MAEHKSDSLVARTSNKILAIILDEKFKIDDQIPSESDLSNLLGVGRNTVREAIRSLVGQNILEIRRGNGTFISHKRGVSQDPLGLMFIENPRRIAEDLIQIRMLLEPTIASLAAQNASSYDILELEKLVIAFETKVSRHEDPVPEDISFHQQIARCSKNVVMPNLIPVISETIRVFTDIKEGQEIHVTIHTHRQIYEAIKNGKPSAAHDAMLLHLAYNRNKLNSTN